MQWLQIQKPGMRILCDNDRAGHAGRASRASRAGHEGHASREGRVNKDYELKTLLIHTN